MQRIIKMRQQVWVGLFFLLLLHFSVAPASGLANSGNDGNGYSKAATQVEDTVDANQVGTVTSAGLVTLTEPLDSSTLRLSEPNQQRGTLRTGEKLIGAASLATTFLLDHELSQILRASSPDSADLLPQAITLLGGEVGMVGLNALLYTQDGELAVRSVKAVAAATIATYMLKTVLGRERPDTPNSTGAFTGVATDDAHHSMPSGHTTAAFAMARVLAGHDPRHAAAYYAGATLVGLSRVHLYRHWPSDVVAGALVGLSIGRVF